MQFILLSGKYEIGKPIVHSLCKVSDYPEILSQGSSTTLKNKQTEIKTKPKQKWNIFGICVVLFLFKLL